MAAWEWGDRPPRARTRMGPAGRSPRSPERPHAKRCERFGATARHSQRALALAERERGGNEERRPGDPEQDSGSAREPEVTQRARPGGDQCQEPECDRQIGARLETAERERLR